MIGLLVLLSTGFRLPSEGVHFGKARDVLLLILLVVVLLLSVRDDHVLKS